MRLLLSAALCLLVVAGCGKNDPPVAASSTSSTPETLRTEPPPAPAPATPAASAGSQADISAVLAELTQAVRKYGVEKQRVPASLDEVVSAGYLQTVPSAPAGKRFAIDRKLQVYLADQ
jgi:hypothetical protein